MEKRKYLTLEAMSHRLNHGDPEYDGDMIAQGAFGKALEMQPQAIILSHGNPAGESWINEKQALPGFYRPFNGRILTEDWNLLENTCHVTPDKIIMHPTTLVSFITQQFGSGLALKQLGGIMDRRIKALFNGKAK